MVLARTWRTSIEAERADEYEGFARTVSLPMFESQQGFLGVIMYRNGASCAVISLWADEQSVEALGQAPSYRDTVEQFLSTGLLCGEQSLEVAQVHLASVAVQKL